MDIELVIKIPEKLACEGFVRLFTEEEKDILIKAIGNGTPLPKGHGDLIDRGKLKTHYVGTDIGTDLSVYLVPTIEEAVPIIESDKEESDG